MMGSLAPLYLAGLAALSLPLLFHLVRRAPRNQQIFSSLMFLAPSPPRLTRRSRLDQILLLLLRLAALAILALAFARPFFRQTALLSLVDVPRRKVAVLLDTSASMRRGDLWAKAVRMIETELDELGPNDEIALYAFGSRLERVVGFDQALENGVANQARLVREGLKSLQPTWDSTNLGEPLTSLATELAAQNDVRQSVAQTQILLVSDFQKGAKLDAIQAFEWPEQVHVIARMLSPSKTTNATLQLLQGEEETSHAEARVRLLNAADSAGDQFFIRWASESSSGPPETEVAVHVPAGETRVVRLPRRETDLVSDRIVLRGDDHDFDNQFFVVPPRRHEIPVDFVRLEPSEAAKDALYYFQLATADDPLRQVRIHRIDPETADGVARDAKTKLVVVTSSLLPTLARQVRDFAEAGGSVLIVPSSREDATAIPAILDDTKLLEPETNSGDFQLIGEINFGHPLFESFASPRYSDFTKIHVWRHHRIELAESPANRVLVRLDNGAPLLIERPIGKGRAWAFTSGWTPEESQFVLSSKFVPFVGALLDQVADTGQTMATVHVGDPVRLKDDAVSEIIQVRSPDGQSHRLGAEDHSFLKTDRPGIYQALAGSREIRFAVNMSASESITTPLELEQFQQFGVQFGPDVRRVDELERLRQQRDVELESRQKIWRWLIVGALCILVCETWLAGRAAAQIGQPPEVVT